MYVCVCPPGARFFLGNPAHRKVKLGNLTAFMYVERVVCILSHAGNLITGDELMLMIMHYNQSMK